MTLKPSCATNFNSIKVRLELPLSTPQTSPPPFQFHKGTIRTGKIIKFNGLRLHFNSIKVRLELRLAAFSLLHLHYFNSIKVRLELRYFVVGEYGTKFQFHKGTIRTTIYQDLCRLLQISIP